MKIKNHLTIEQIKQKLKTQNKSHLFSAWQIILSVGINPGIKAEQLSAILGVSKHKVYSIITSYNKFGQTFKEEKRWGGRREETSHMSLKEESKILEGVKLQALKGEILTYHDIMAVVEKKLNKKVSDDYIWDMLKRHKWSKTVPRPHHPKNDKAKMAEFKKNSRRSWSPAS